MIIPRPWGFIDRDEPSGRYRVDTLFVAPGGYCSKHRHARASHEFSVNYGDIAVEKFPSPDGASFGRVLLVDTHQTCHVPAGTIHRFRAGARGAVVVEVTWDFEEEDIERFEEGGIA